MIQVMNVARRIVPTADGTTEYTLEPLPLTSLVLSWQGSVTAANTLVSLTDLLNMITNIEVLVAGTTVFQANGRDTAFISACLLGRPPRYTPAGVANNDLSQIYMVIPFGRRWAGGPWGLPATPAGQLRLRLTADIAVGTLDTLTWSVDAVHDDSLTPDGFYRVTTLAAAPTATGDFNVDLPTGRPMAGCALFATTQRVTEAGAYGINRVKILRDAIEDRYPSAEWETIQGLAAAQGTLDMAAWDHNHRENTAGAYTQNAVTANQTVVTGIDYQYAWLNFDPLMDGSGFLDLTTCNRAVLRLNMGIAEALRVIPVEWWPVTGAGGSRVPSLGV